MTTKTQNAVIVCVLTDLYMYLFLQICLVKVRTYVPTQRPETITTFEGLTRTREFLMNPGDGCIPLVSFPLASYFLALIALDLAHFISRVACLW